VSEKLVTRRDFLRAAGAAAVVATAGVPLVGQDRPAPKARVVLVRDETVLDSAGEADRTILERMFDDAVVDLFEVDRPGEAWKRIAGSSDIVGIKTNVWNYLRTPVLLENAMKERLMGAGVPEKNIGIDDRGVLRNPIFQNATVLINARPMRAHHWSGVGGLLKNYIMFTPEPPDYHPDSCIDLGALWKLPAVKGKTRLNVLIMLTPQFHCLGPHHFDREFTWRYNGLLVGTDPVAVDAVGLSIIEAQRRRFFKEDSPLRPPAKHIRAAQEKHGIGIADLRLIEIRKIGWKEGILI
jgi:hypothetical protein